MTDPHFVGANAIGVSGLNMSGGTGLATAQTGGGGASAGGALLATSAQGSSSGAGSSSGSGKGSGGGLSKSSGKKSGSSANGAGAGGDSPKSSGGLKKKLNGTTPNGTASDLRKLVEEGGEVAEQIKTCIIRAAVHASRTGKHGQPFIAPDGKTYPDVAKAFAAHAGLKPCIRCKNNKQGVSPK